MIEKEIDLSAVESAAAAPRRKKGSRSKNSGWSILVLLLAVLLVVGLSFGLYSGSFSRLVLQKLQDEGAKLLESNQTLMAENAEKGAQLDARSAHSGELDAQLAALRADSAEKDTQIEGLSAESAEKAALVDSLSAENADRDAQIEGLTANRADADAKIESLVADNAAKDAQIDTLTAENAAKDTQIADLSENLPVYSAAKDTQIETLTAENEEKDARIDTLNTEITARDAQIEDLDAEDAERDAQLRDLDAEIAGKNGQLNTLRAQLAAAKAPLLYQDALREAIPAAALEAALPESLGENEELKTVLLTELLSTALLGKDPEETREDHLAFRIWTADGQLIGSVAFEPVAGADADLPVWTAVEERFDFSGCDISNYFTTASITVPADYQVYFDTTLLGSEWIREEGLPYETFSACPEFMESLPGLVRYETPPFIGEPALRILNEKGQEIPAEDLSESLFLDRCPEEIREQIEAFLPDFCELFLLFSADIHDSANYYYQQLKPLVLPDSLLAGRLKDAFEGLGYSAARKAELDSVRVNSITDLGDGRYAVDLNYLSYVTGHSSSFDPVEDDLHLLLILTLAEDGRLLAEAMYYL